jgi:hypothetical protein
MRSTHYDSAGAWSEHLQRRRGNRGGVMGRLETKCPWTNFQGSLVPKIIRQGNTMSLYWHIPVIMHHIYILYNAYWQGFINPGTLCFRVDSSGSQKIRTGHTVRGVPSPHHLLGTFTKGIFVLWYRYRRPIHGEIHSDNQMTWAFSS